MGCDGRNLAEKIRQPATTHKKLLTAARRLIRGPDAAAPGRSPGPEPVQLNEATALVTLMKASIIMTLFG